MLMSKLNFLNIVVGNLNQKLTKEQRKMLLCEYSDIDKIPQEMRDFIADFCLKNENSYLKKFYSQCGITNREDMVDNILRNLYLLVNYIPKEEWEEDMRIY